MAQMPRARYVHERTTAALQTSIAHDFEPASGHALEICCLVALAGVAAELITLIIDLIRYPTILECATGMP